MATGRRFLKKNREKVDELRKMFGQMGAVAGEQVGGKNDD